METKREVSTLTADYLEMKRAEGVTHFTLDIQHIARIYGKRHADVLRAVEKCECSQEFSERNFAFATYKDAQGKNRPEVLMTRWFFLCSSRIYQKRSRKV